MEESAFEHIAIRLRRRALDASRACGLGQMAAEDIAQDVMLKLWSMRDDLERFSSLDALASVMARRLSLNKLRDERTLAIDDSSYRIKSQVAGPLEILEEKENEQWLDRKMAALPRAQHAILYMRQVERRSNKEIAALLAISEASVSTLLARARKALLDELRAR